MRNFKSIRDATLSDLGTFNILVGKNNSGKSTILDAIQLFMTELLNTGSTSLDDHIWTFGVPDNPIMFHALFELNKEDFEEARSAKVPFLSRRDLPSPLKIELQKTLWKEKKWTYPSVHAIVQHNDELNIGEATGASVSPAPEIVSFIHRHLGLKRIDVIRGQTPSQGIGQGLRETLVPRETLDSIKRWHNSRTNADRLKLLDLDSIFRKLTGRDWSLVQEGDNLCVNDRPYGAEVRALGGGIQEMVHLAFQLVETPQVLMIEEPEAHSHPGQTKVVFEILRDLSKSHQIFVTTHSTVFLEYAAFSEVYNVYKDGDFTECSKIKDKEFENLAADMGLKPIDLYMTGALLFVEGECDETVLRAWGDMLRLNLRPPDVQIIRMDGMDRSKYLIEVWKQIVSAIHTPMAWVFDYGLSAKERVDLLIRGLKAAGMGNNALKVLSKGDVEDYYPETLLLDHLAERWGLDEAKKSRLKGKLTAGSRVKSVTDFLRNEGDPQPDGTEWKRPAAQYIAKSGKLEDYSKAERDEIRQLIQDIRTALKLSPQ